jgi:hypothetical protein
MWRYLFGGLLTLSLAIFILSGSAQSDIGTLPTAQETVIYDSPEGHPQVVCVIDLDCGFSGYDNTSCSGLFVSQEYHTYKCVGAGSLNASCANETRNDILDWCRPDEECVPGKYICQPKVIITDAQACGGINGPCLSCGNGIKDIDEAGVDCGGPCRPCHVACVSNESCGIPRWGPQYCKADGSVYQDLVAYSCANPGTYDSFCKQNRMTRRTDYCGPTNPCMGGRCVDDADREPYAYLDGGYFGHNRTRLTEEYDCVEGDPCYTKSDAINTCVGDSCYDVLNIDQGTD